jgi:putative spermidine/putrescine transport system ATP-binding protein
LTKVSAALRASTHRSLQPEAMGESRPQAGSAGPPLVEFRGVSKSYDGRHAAVAGLSCAIRQGEFLTFLGPSGSGKTTALMMLAGFETPTAGDILLNGHSLARTPPHRRNMGVVFQNYALFPHMTVEQNVAFALSVRSVTAAEVRQRVARALALVQLSGLELRRPAELSGGQQQRVGVGGGVIFAPHLVLMDEPLGALDKQLREQLQLQIKHLQQQLGVTVIYVTHDQSEALTLSDRIAVFNRGTIQQIDTPREIYERPASLFVAQFVGQNNRLDGRIVSLEGTRCTVRTEAGLIIRAQLIGPGSLGGEVILCIRPMRIVMGSLAQSAQTADTNWFTARVEETVYHGDHAAVLLRLDGGPQLVAHSNGPPDEAPATGDAVRVGWLVQHCRGFSATAGPEALS